MTSPLEAYPLHLSSSWLSTDVIHHSSEIPADFIAMVCSVSARLSFSAVALLYLILLSERGSLDTCLGSGCWLSSSAPPAPVAPILLPRRRCPPFNKWQEAFPLAANGWPLRRRPRQSITRDAGLSLFQSSSHLLLYRKAVGRPMSVHHLDLISTISSFRMFGGPRKISP